MPPMQTVFDKISLADKDTILAPRNPIAVPEDRLAAVHDISDWILDEGVLSPDVETLLDGFANRLEASGIPLSRVMISNRVLAATVIARGYRWRPGQPIQVTTFDWEDRDTSIYHDSPIKVVHETLDWFAIDVPETPDSAFGIVPDLRAEGVTEYYIGPMIHSDGRVNVINFSTIAENGLSGSDKAVLRSVTRPFGIAVELITGRMALGDVLSIYVGRRAAAEIVAGTVHRGEVMRINSAIMMADMRDFTRLTMNMTAEDSADLLNRYYDCVVPPVEAHGGIVLKFVGDGILVIFPDDTHGPQEACARALRAAQDALGRLNDVCSNGKCPFQIGIALHHGTAAYGNVGSGERLDFTVVGRDVNFTDRIGRLNKVLGEPLIASQAFSRTLGKPMRALGRHVVPSFDEGIDAFVPEIDP